MRTIDKYINSPGAGIEGKNIDTSSSIPEDRITENCVNSIAKKLGIHPDIVHEVHNFQWAKVKEGADAFKTIYVSKFFKLRLSKQKVQHYITEIEKQMSQLDEKMKYVKSNDKKKIQQQKNALQEKIEVLKVQLNKCMQDNKKI